MIRTVLNNIFYFLFDVHKSKKRIFSFIVLSLILLYLGITLRMNIEHAVNNLLFIKRPFEWISGLLKAIALSGSIGNIVAIILTIILSFSPLIVFLVRVKKHPNTRLTFILNSLFYTTLSLLIYITLYLHINPSLIVDNIRSFITTTNVTEMNQLLSNEDMKAYTLQYRNIFLVTLVFTIVFYLFLYMVIHFYHTIKGNRLCLFKASNLLLSLVKIVYVFLYLYGVFLLPMNGSYKLNGIDAIHVRNILFIQILFNYVSITLLLFFIRLLHDLFKNYTEEKLFEERNVSLLFKLAKVTLILLISSLLYQFVYNGYQLINASDIQNLNYSYTFPITEFVLALVFYLLSLLMDQSYKIYKENCLTI